ncbi:MAG: hypothetical protein BGO38_01275 [Cellulomonas sp. 73-145]|uniref:ThiF family adenylyltransferase n=1 Tax=Cellulomonas sp. 73-145 TaxID=1895739 RepID=UPI0009279F8B|nr:ThiF family adenylyltransferase [Cellulomonas sp. 73-145]MBN9326704.1 ThiF family adenylyltransferase [Cellulomonas sp.]OJV60319.1 MAG: hypothetical protein BGO38_01275 [Cellulomonas sp. 73-145]
MSPSLVSRNADLKRLRDEGFEIQVKDNHLLLLHVPYVTPARIVAYGTLVSTLNLNGDAVMTPDTHVVYFHGERPSRADGAVVPNLLHSSGTTRLTEAITVDFSFSNKPEQGFSNYFDKMTSYANILWGHALQLDPEATPKTYVVHEDEDDDSPFLYADSASTRAEIAAINAKLKLNKIAIVGVGGTGSYILDLVAKTPVREIHLFDGDKFLQHNAFRAPGAARKEDFANTPRKVNYHADRYAMMRTGIVPHPYDIDNYNRDELATMDFVFLAAEGGTTKRLVVQTLEDAGIPFIDVGMGVYRVRESLAGVLAVTTSTNGRRDHVHVGRRIDFTDSDEEGVYAQNIQIADLNALNATLAVIRWKKLYGVYLDLEQEHYSAYTLDGNHLLNEDHPDDGQGS